jgi:flagellar protein FlaJ
MEIKLYQWISIFIALAGIISGYFLLEKKLFPLIAGISALIGITPFIINIINQARIANQKEEMFLEFARNLVESVKTGTPISKSIINMSNKSYGVLTENVQKLANQISLGIPFNKALEVFSKDVRNKSITRSLTLIGQAERAGGDIGEILEDVAEAVNMSDKLKKERKSSISTLVVQGYIIFLIFIIIILIMQFKIIPIVSGISNLQSLKTVGIGITPGVAIMGGEKTTQNQVANAFLYLILTQSFFTGLVIGRLAEGNIKAGIKHSFALMFLSFLISAAASALFGG